MSVYFWLILTLACLVWYTAVTIIVAVRGVADIREMMARLGARDSDSVE